MITVYKELSEKGKLSALKCIVKNNNRKTIEEVNLTDLLDLIDDYKTLIELLKQSKCEVISSQEAAALELYEVGDYGDDEKYITMTEAEFNYCVRYNVAPTKIYELRKVYESLKKYEVTL